MQLQPGGDLGHLAGGVAPGAVAPGGADNRGDRASHRGEAGGGGAAAGQRLLGRIDDRTGGEGQRQGRDEASEPHGLAAIMNGGAPLAARLCGRPELWTQGLGTRWTRGYRSFSFRTASVALHRAIFRGKSDYASNPAAWSESGCDPGVSGLGPEDRHGADAPPAPGSPVLSPDAQALLAPWTGPYGGLPPFAQVKVSAFQPALEEAMRREPGRDRRHRRQPRAAPPSTTPSPRRSGRASALGRVMTLYGVWGSTENHADMQAVQQAMDPKIAEFQDKISQNPKLFARIDAVYQARDHFRPDARAEAAGLVLLDQRGEERRPPRPHRQGPGHRHQPGAGRPLCTVQPEPAGRRGRPHPLSQAGRSRGPAAIGAGRRRRGRRRQGPQGRVGGAEHPLLRRSVPDLFGTDRRDLRQQVWTTFYARGDNKDAHDNTAPSSRASCSCAPRRPT